MKSTDRLHSRHISLILNSFTSALCSYNFTFLCGWLMNQQQQKQE